MVVPVVPNGTTGTLSQYVYVRPYLDVDVYHYAWYTCTNITLSQKRLEIQALRCNGDTSGRCQHRRHHGILQLRFQLDSDVCSADLHHNPRKHVGTMVQCIAIPFGTMAVRTRVRTIVVVAVVCASTDMCTYTRVRYSSTYDTMVWHTIGTLPFWYCCDITL